MTTNTQHPTVYKDTKALAQVRPLSESWLTKKRISGGGPPFLKIGRRVVYRLSDVDDWLAKCTRTAA